MINLFLFNYIQYFILKYNHNYYVFQNKTLYDNLNLYKKFSKI